MVFCKCDSWDKSMKCINGAQTLAYHHGWAYEGETMVFCPWCGKRLKKEDSDKKASKKGLKRAVKRLSKKAMRRSHG